MPSPKIISANDFALLIGGVDSFFSTHAQLSTVSQQDYQRPQQQQHQYSRAQIHRPSADCYAPESETRLPVITAAECNSGAAHDQKALGSWNTPPPDTSARTRGNHIALGANPEHESLPLESVHNNTKDSNEETVVGESVQGVEPVIKMTLAASSKSTKEYQPVALATNATEFIANFVWDLAPVTLSNDSSNRSVIFTHLSELDSATVVPHSIKDRSVGYHLHPTRDVLDEHYDKQRSKSYVDYEGGILSGYNRQLERFRSDPYSPAEMMPGSDNSHSAQIALERLRLHQDESISTTFTEEEKLALIEHGRIIGNRGSWDREDYQRINNGINTINHHRQQRQRTSPYPIYPLLRGRSGSFQPQFRSRITYSREFLMGFSDFSVPPDSIDRIHWIQQHTTLDWSQKPAGPIMPRSQQQPEFQGPIGDFQGSYRPGQGRRPITGERGGGGRGEMSTLGFLIPHLQAPTPPRPNVNRPNATASGSLRSVYSFNKSRDPLGPPVTPPGGFRVRGFHPGKTM